jgi:hypothetical protein
MVFSTSAIAPDEFADRNEVTLTLLLTLVALKLLVSELVPKTSYLTMADWYIVVSFLTIVSVIAENFFVAVFPETGSQAQADTDKFYMSILFSLHLGFNLVYAVCVLSHLHSRGAAEEEQSGTKTYKGAIEVDSVEDLCR